MTSSYDNDSLDAGWDSPERAQRIALSYLVEGDYVLDIGIGTGQSVKGYAQRGIRVVGIDHDLAMLASAQDIVGKDGSLRLADINHQLPLDDLRGTIKLAQAVGVLEFVEDLFRLLSQVHDVLKTEGLFIFTAELLNLQDDNEVVHYPESHITVYRHSVTDIASMLERARFDVVTVETYDGYRRGDALVPYAMIVAKKR